MLMRYAGCTALAAALIVLAAGCARPASSEPPVAASSEPSVAASSEPSVAASSEPPVAASSEPSVAASSAPIVPPNLTKSPPDNPTDLQKPYPWIVGTVTAGGTGPCYGLETDEGQQYALHSTAGTRLDKGARIRIKATPARVRINCGPGKLLEMTAAEPVR
jgi:hypothetical protein